MELPTYTNIWKIEKRLYKLYDFRLPMPLPVGQIAAFLVIAVPYTLVLTMVGLPFSHTWVWLYVLPPAVLAWLVTRPVLEGKRLPELLLSQLRYLSEPQTWCRLAPLTESDETLVVVRVWRSGSVAVSAGESAPLGVTASSDAREPSRAETPVAESAAVTPAVTETDGYDLADTGLAGVESAATGPARPGGQPGRVRPRATASASVDPLARAPEGDTSAGLVPAGAAGSAANAVVTGDASAKAVVARDEDVGLVEADEPSDTSVLPSRPLWPHVGPVRPFGVHPAGTGQTGVAASDNSPADSKPAGVKLTGDVGSQNKQLNVVERALRSAPANRTGGWRDHVVLVAGGHRPGKPDLIQRDQSRARLPLPGPARIVVLGCTAGAGQTVTTLLTGQLLATLRGEAVAVVDLSHGKGSLTERARAIPALLPSRDGTRPPARRGASDPLAPDSGSQHGLQVITASESADDPEDIVNAVVERYPLALADPAAGVVPRTLRAADQLILVAPASAEAAGSLAMTMEWLEAHDHDRLAASAITVLNGVSAQTAQFVTKAATVASGRCHAIVQVPWDERLVAESAGPLDPATVRGYTALAGLLVSALADAASRSVVQ